MRSGVIAKKLGMTRLFTEDGRQVPVTVLQMDGCQVVAKVRDSPAVTSNTSTCRPSAACGSRGPRSVSRSGPATAVRIVSPSWWRRLTQGRTWP